MLDTDVSKEPDVFVFGVEEFVSDGFEFTDVYCRILKVVTSSLTDMTLPDVKNEFFFMG